MRFLCSFCCSNFYYFRASYRTEQSGFSHAITTLTLPFHTVYWMIAPTNQVSVITSVLVVYWVTVVWCNSFDTLTGKAGVGSESGSAGEVQRTGVRTAGCEGRNWSIFHSGTHQSQTSGVYLSANCVNYQHAIIIFIVTCVPWDWSMIVFMNCLHIHCLAVNRPIFAAWSLIWLSNMHGSTPV